MLRQHMHLSLMIRFPAFILLCFAFPAFKRNNYIQYPRLSATFTLHCCCSHPEPLKATKVSDVDRHAAPDLSLSESGAAPTPLTAARRWVADVFFQLLHTQISHDMGGNMVPGVGQAACGHLTTEVSHLIFW